LASLGVSLEGRSSSQGDSVDLELRHCVSEGTLSELDLAHVSKCALGRQQDQRGLDRGRGRMDETTRRELRRKQLCFTCKEPWDPTHKCMGKGKAHYIEVISDDEEEEDFGHLQNIEANPTVNTKEEDVSHSLVADEKVTLASISRVPKFNTFRMRGATREKGFSSHRWGCFTQLH
jgi:hypothetical protein